MSEVVLGWFPSAAFANIFAVVVLAAAVVDGIIPRLVGGRAHLRTWGGDRGSFLGIQLAAVIGILAATFLRSRDIGLVPSWVQVLALVLVLLGAAIREWAVLVLGRFFSRTVQIQQGHRLITDGPYRWIRHPAYTGMLTMDTAIVLGLGTWAGALVMFGVVLGATLYRIRVEELALTERFGSDYCAYAKRTWLLFPGW